MLRWYHPEVTAGEKAAEKPPADPPVRAQVPAKGEEAEPVYQVA